MQAGTQLDAAPFSGDCLSPVVRQVIGREAAILPVIEAANDWRDWPLNDYADGYGFTPGSEVPSVRGRRTVEAHIAVRCRKCEACLRYRRRLWTARAISEVRQSRRTWFLTLTYAPAARFVATERAQTRYLTGRVDWLHMTAQERFRTIERETGKDVTLFFKRLRKNTGARFRYLLVSEAHEDGFPHYHALLHETANVAVTKRAIQGAWRAGFSHAKLIEYQDAKATGYVCKYLSKSAATRVRASQKYGSLSGATLDGVLNAVRYLTTPTPEDVGRHACQERGKVSEYPET